MNMREQKGIEIAQRLKIVQQDNKWIGPSQTGKGKYTVDIDGKVPHCTCPDYELRGFKCKHIYAVEYPMKQELDSEQETAPVTKMKRPTYKQDWPAYNAAQTHEKAQFQSLLYALCQGVKEPVQTFGRPRLPLADMVFSAAFKIYSTVSTRRFMRDLNDAYVKGVLDKLKGSQDLPL